MRSISDAERRARLARRHRLVPGSRAEHVEAAAEALVGLHATDLSSVHLAAFARVDGVRRDDVDAALYDRRSLVTQMAMRRTLFVFPRATLPAAIHGAGARVAAAQRRALVRSVERAGLDGASWVAAVATEVVAALESGPPATSAELRAAVPSLAMTTSQGAGRWGGDQPVGPRVLVYLSASGQIARAANAGTWLNPRPTWTTMTSWLGAAAPEIDEADARRTLVEQWLRAFGPGTLHDLTWWLGDTVGHVRAALHELDAVEVALEGGGTGYVLPDDVEPVEPVEPWAALLPSLDPTTMGWHERDWYLGAHRAALFDTAGNAGTTAWWNGRIVGGWHQPDGDRVVVHLLEDVEPAAVSGRSTTRRRGSPPGWTAPDPGHGGAHRCSPGRSRHTTSPSTRSSVGCSPARAATAAEAAWSGWTIARTSPTSCATSHSTMPTAASDA